MANIEIILAMDDGENCERFRWLIEAQKANRLAVFWGAGLSLGGVNSRRWETPFMNMLKSLKSMNKDKFYRPEVETELIEAEAAIRRSHYPLAGAKLNKAFDYLKDSYRKKHSPALFYPQMTFNQFLIDSFQFDYKEVAEASFDNPYKINALFYIPFLGRRGLTTNIDRSYSEAAKRVGKKRNPHTLRTFDTPAHICNIDNKDFAIHGLETEPDTLVFTEPQYDQVYRASSETGSKWLLKDTIANYTVLFLGASLRTDNTVDVINETTPGSYLIPLYGVVREGKEEVSDKTPNLECAFPLLYNSGKYYEISYLLLTLLRLAAANKWACCQWYNSDSTDFSSAETVSEKMTSKIRAFLSSSERYKELWISNEDAMPYQNLIKHLCEQYSIEKAIERNDGAGWSICRITNYEFSLGGEKGFSVLHNYPLGDTVYVIASSRRDGEDLTYGDAETIVKEIREWRNSLEEESLLRPRVRVIVFPLRPNSEAAKSKRAFEDRIAELLVFLDDYEEKVKERRQTGIKQNLKAPLKELRKLLQRIKEIISQLGALATLEMEEEVMSRRLTLTNKEKEKK